MSLRPARAFLAVVIVIGLLGAGERMSQGLPWPYPLRAPPPLVVRTAQRHGLDQHLVWAIIWHESRNDPSLITVHAGGAPDVGLMQVNLATVHAMSTPRWQTITVAELLDPETNVECGCLILRWYLYESLRAEGVAIRDVYGVGPALAQMTPEMRLATYGRALAGYNAGAAALRAWPAVSPPVREYVDAVLTVYRQW